MASQNLQEEKPPVVITLDHDMARRWRRWLWILIGMAVVLWLAYLVREIWLPLCIALLIAMVLDPVVDRMERRGWSRTLATSLIFAGFFLSAGVAFYFAVPSVVRQAGAISKQVAEYIPAAGNQARAHRSMERLMDRAHAPEYVRGAVERGITQLSANVNRSTAWVGTHLIDLLSNLIWLVIIPLVTFYALKDFHLLFAKALLLVPRERRELMQTLVAEVTGIFARFLRGLAIVSFLNGVATWILLEIVRLPNAFTLGIIAGVLYSVPYFGALTTIVLIAGVAFVASGSSLTYVALVVGLSVLLHQVLFDQIISPRILGGHVGLHPILSIIALLIGNVLLGIVGMILAVPVAASIQIVILTLVPKLAHEIDVSAGPTDEDSVGSLSKETTDVHIGRDAREDLHRSVSQAVEAIEAKTGVEGRE